VVFSIYHSITWLTWYIFRYDRAEIVKKVKALGFPRGSFVVFGSGPLALAGIREANDVDMLITPELYAKLELEGWQKISKGLGDEPLIQGDIEVHPNWDFSSYKPSLKDLLSRAKYVDGVAFASIADVRKWKVDHDHPNREEVLRQIDTYLREYLG